MGIKPDGSANAPRADTAESRFGDLSTAVKSDGGIVSGEVSKISAKAESSNAATAELAADITGLENRVTALEKASGPDLSGYATKSDVDAARRHVGVFSGVTSAGSSRVNVPLSAKGDLPDGWEKGGASVTLPAGAYRIEFWLGSTDELNLVGLTPSQNLTPPSNSRNDRNLAVLTTLTARTSFYLRSLPTSGQELTMVVDRLA